MGDRLRPGVFNRENSKKSFYDLAQELERRSARPAAAYRLTMSAETVKQIVTALYSHAALVGGPSDNYTIDRWDNRRGSSLDRQFGKLNDFDGALAAYQAIVAKYPDDHITLRNRARLIKHQNEPLTPP